MLRLRYFKTFKDKIKMGFEAPDLAIWMHDAFMHFVLVISLILLP